MLVFEILPDAVDVKEDILSTFPDSKVASVDSLDGNDFLQILVPLVSVMMPVISQILQKYFDDNRVTIKYDGVEISALGYDKAMNILKEVLAQRDNSNKE
ncbi:MAG: hypothetical protein HDT15_03975 [Oscillibacter sp.]|nr:hypothetical protein [Oscillibacter sp.]